MMPGAPIAASRIAARPAGRRLLLCCLIALSLAGLQPAMAGDASGHKAVTVQDRLCRYDLKCWAERFIAEASRACSGPVARLAGEPHRWTDTPAAPRFSHYRWKSLDSGTVTYLGDRLEVQNDFGAWRAYVYECDFDTALESATDVRIAPGRL